MFGQAQQTADSTKTLERVKAILPNVHVVVTDNYLVCRLAYIIYTFIHHSGIKNKMTDR